jgi:TonB family protein
MEYLIKSGISLTVFYFLYWLILRNDTHFVLNRIVLFSCLILSIVLPLLSISMPSEVVSAMPALNITFDKVIVPAQNIKHSWNALNFFTLLYFIGMAVVFARLIYQAIYLHAVSRLSKTIKHNELTIVLMTTEISPFSYFNKIFIPASKADDYSIQGIIEHEKSHKKQHHFVDLFFIELVTMVHWFNPIAWLYEQSIKEVHEYLADKSVISRGYSQGKYQALLVNEAIGGPVFILTNQFNKSIIKKRIKMMKKMKTSRLAQLKALLFVPLVAGLLMAFANPNIASRTSDGNKEVVITGKVTDKISGRSFSNVLVALENTNIGTITDAEGNYTLKIPADKVTALIFSHVGFKTTNVPIGNKNVINIQLEDETIVIDSEKSGTEKARVSSEKADSKGNGADMYVAVEENPSYIGGTTAMDKYMTANLQYPESAKKKGIQGRVYVQFTINKNGNVQDAIIMRGVDPALDKEAIRVISTMPDWNPGTQNGKSVDSKVTMPVEFSLK